MRMDILFYVGWSKYNKRVDKYYFTEAYEYLVLRHLTKVQWWESSSITWPRCINMVALRHLTKIQCRESTSITLPRRKDMLFYVSWSKYNRERVGKYYFTTSTKFHSDIIWWFNISRAMIDNVSKFYFCARLLWSDCTSKHCLIFQY